MTTSEPTPTAAAGTDHHVWFVIWPGLQVLDLAGPHEVFETANRVADGLGRGGPRYRLRVIANTASSVRTESGLRLGCDPLPDPPARPDTLVLPGGDGVHDACDDVELLTAVTRLGTAADRVATVCSGVFLAAAAELVDEQRVATHWARTRRLTEAHPRLDVDADSLYVNDGRVWSSAGVTAGIDLALAIVEHDHDAEVAQIVGRWLVVHLRRPGGQSQFASPMWTAPSTREPIRHAQDVINADVTADLGVAALAARVGLSPRHFSRLFTAETGRSPARFVEDVRLERARGELESGDGGLAPLAERCGFGTAETLRRVFVRRLGIGPDEYRRRFRLAPA